MVRRKFSLCSLLIYCYSFPTISSSRLSYFLHFLTSMEGERRKRKLQNEEENEDEKMERFYALIRSTKGVRDRLSKEKETNKLEQDRLQGNTSVWNPKFQPEDFLDFQDFISETIHSSTPAAGSSQVEAAVDKETEGTATGTATAKATGTVADDQDREIKGSDNLDLTLSL